MHALRLLWKILSPPERRRAIVVLGLMLVGTAIEMLSIGLVVPALAFATGDTAAIPAVLRDLAARSGDPTSPARILVLLLAIVGVYAAKSAFLLFATSNQSRFVTAVQANAGRRLFATFMAQPWTFHLQRNSAVLTQAINESQQLSIVCLSLIQVVSELLVMAGLLALLLWMEPLGATVVAATLGLAFWAFNGLARPRARRWATARQHHVRKYLEQVQQALGGAKEVKLRGCERQFLDQFHIHTEASARMMARQSVIERAPRMWFELLAVIALFLLAAAMAWQGRPTRALVPMLGLFATVAFRAIPSISYAAAAVQRLRQFEPILESLGRHLADEPAAAPDRPATGRAFRDCIRLEHVSYAYPGGRGTVLQGIDMVIPHGAAVGVIGGSGAGKTTLIDVLLGLLPPTAGRVTVDGVDIQDDPRGWQRLVGYVPQSIFLSDDTIRRNVAFGVPDEAIDDEAVRRALGAARLDQFVARLPDGPETVVGERGLGLSGGQRQRIGIARALYHDPEVLVLDEATSALDDDTEREVMAAVDSLHGVKTLVIVAHRLGTVAKCDVLHRLEGGRVVRSGSFAEVTAG